MGRKTIFTGTFIHTPTPTTLSILENAAVFVDECGVIVHIDSDASCKEARINNDLDDWSGAELVFARASANEFFFPGFVDTHIHASQYPNAGIFGKSTLLDWLEKYTFPLEASLEDTKKAKRVYSRCIERTLANGTTTAAYYGTRAVDSTNLLADLCLAAGQRAFVGRLCMDQNSPDWYRDESVEAAIRDTEKTVEHCAKIDPERRMVSAIVTPRFAPTCTAELLKSLGDLARRENLPIQTHVSENKPEVAWVSELFPTSKSYTDVYNIAGLLTDRTILAHAVHLTNDEIELIKQNDVKISHCPVSNLALTSGCAKVKTLMKRGIDVGLGTDMSGGYSASILETARQATLVSRMVTLEDGEEAKLSVVEVLYLSTRGGAKVVGLADKIGAFEVGMQFDALLVSLGSSLEDEDEDEEKETEKEAETGKEMEMEMEKERHDHENQQQEVEQVEAKVQNGHGEEIEEKDEDMLGELLPLTEEEPEEKQVKPSEATTTTGAYNRVEEGPVDVFGWEDWEEKIAKWVYNGDSRNMEGVWVAGSRVYTKGGSPPTWSLNLEK